MELAGRKDKSEQRRRKREMPGASQAAPSQTWRKQGSRIIERKVKKSLGETS